MHPSNHSKAFTLVELLVVVAIIALLVGIMVPAVQNAMNRAKDGVVKTQMHNIGFGLNLFKNDYDEYPTSTDTVNNPARPGAELLCTYLVGDDLLGYPDPDTIGLTRDPYIKLETAEFEAWGSGHIIKCKWGFPILYYAAAPGASLSDDIDVVYDDEDNADFIEAYTERTGADADPLVADFYNIIANPQITARAVPYNHDSFILISAGKDGIYGSEDDVMNFEK